MLQLRFKFSRLFYSSKSFSGKRTNKQTNACDWPNLFLTLKKIDWMKIWSLGKLRTRPRVFQTEAKGHFVARTGMYLVPRCAFETAFVYELRKWNHSGRKLHSNKYATRNPIAKLDAAFFGWFIWLHWNMVRVIDTLYGETDIGTCQCSAHRLNKSHNYLAQASRWGDPI
jgi:hypothetical protein